MLWLNVMEAKNASFVHSVVPYRKVAVLKWWEPNKTTRRAFSSVWTVGEPVGRCPAQY